jgi:hypothetical protein
MQEIEKKAENYQRGWLYLDVITGSSAQKFYRSYGNYYLGELPDYALCADGHPHPGIIYYKRLRTDSAENVATSH